MIHRNLLKKLKRANKERKLKLAKENGFQSVEEYKTHLESNLEELPDKPIIHIYHVLDSSNSMFSGLNPSNCKMEKAIRGIEHEIKELKKVEDIDYIVSVHEFSTNNKRLINAKPVHKIKNIKWIRYRWGTTLNDTIYAILRDLKTKNDPNIRVLIKVFTDGYDQHSRRYNYMQVANMITSLPNNITFTFVAAEQDAHRIKLYEIDETNVLYHQNTSEDVEFAFSVTRSATAQYSQNVLEGKDVITGFYKDLK